MEAFFTSNSAAAISFFFIFAIIVGVLATVVTKLAVAIKDKAQLPDGVIGGILIGAITSIPEFITAIGVTVNGVLRTDYNPASVFGDVIGSNMFCILIIAVTLLITVKTFRHRETDQINTITIICLIFGAVMCILAVLFENNGIVYGSQFGKPDSPLVWHGFNFFSIFIFLSYAFAVMFMIAGSRIKPAAVVGKGVATTQTLPRGQKAKRSKFLKMSMGLLIVLLIVGIGALSGASIVLSTACAVCIDLWNLGEVFGRTLLLGVATSLPELIAVATLAKNSRYNMAINSMVGSCAFNMIILSVCNAVYAGLWRPGTDPMFPQPQEKNSVVVQVVIFILMCLLFALYLILNSKHIKSRLTNNQIIAINAVLLSLVVVAYISFLILGIVQWPTIEPQAEELALLI
ncbi:MAG: hypothetical protein KBS35_02380 [Mycoplasma sp.]|nr:hypothetical protein [Candidatus Hennigella equi]